MQARATQSPRSCRPRCSKARRPTIRAARPAPPASCSSSRSTRAALVTNTTVLESAGAEFDAAALAAAARLRFSPATRDGEAIPAAIPFRFDFEEPPPPAPAPPPVPPPAPAAAPAAAGTATASRQRRARGARRAARARADAPLARAERGAHDPGHERRCPARGRDHARRRARGAARRGAARHPRLRAARQPRLRRRHVDSPRLSPRRHQRGRARRHPRAPRLLSRQLRPAVRARDGRRDRHRAARAAPRSAGAGSSRSTRSTRACASRGRSANTAAYCSPRAARGSTCGSGRQSKARARPRSTPRPCTCDGAGGARAGPLELHPRAAVGVRLGRSLRGPDRGAERARPDLGRRARRIDHVRAHAAAARHALRTGVGLGQHALARLHRCGSELRRRRLQLRRARGQRALRSAPESVAVPDAQRRTRRDLDALRRRRVVPAGPRGRQADRSVLRAPFAQRRRRSRPSSVPACTRASRSRPCPRSS